MTDRSSAGAPVASRRKRRTRVAMFATGLMAVVLAGCSQFNAPPTGAQQDVIGAVRISSVVCNSGFGSSDQASPPSSPSPCDTNGGGSGNYVGQYLVGYMIPQGSTFPTTLTATELPGNTFSLSPSYAAALQAQQGAQAGMHWVGYISDTVTKVTTNELVHIDAEFSLPPQAGAPFSGPLHTTEVIGDREVYATYLASRPVDCSESRPTNAPVGFPQTESLTSCIQDTATTDVVTRDLALQAGTGGSVKPGGTITVPYSAQFAGPAGPQASFALTANTDLPGATATPANATLQPAGDSTTPETVDVTVPADATPGTYTVRLSAAVAGLQRTADATFTVAPAAPVVTPDAPVVPATPPALPVLTQALDGVKRPSLASLSVTGMPVTVGCNQACTTTVDVLAYQNTRYKHASTRSKKGSMRAAWKLQPTVLIGRQYVNQSATGTKSVRVKLFPAAKAALKHVNTYTLVVRTTSVDANGDQRTSAKVAKVRYANVCAHKQGCITKLR